MSELPNRSTGSSKSLESSTELLLRARSGDSEARDHLFARYLPRLKRWAHGRLPRRARSLLDTDDLVQNALLRAFSHLDGFEPRHEGAFLAYLRQIALNCIRDELRSARARREHVEIDAQIADHEPSPIERVVGREMVERYEAALTELEDHQREAILMRLEMGMSYREIASALGRPSEDAARQVILRGLARLARAMYGHR